MPYKDHQGARSACAPASFLVAVHRGQRYLAPKKDALCVKFQIPSLERLIVRPYTFHNKNVRKKGGFWPYPAGGLLRDVDGRVEHLRLLETGRRNPRQSSGRRPDES